MQLTLVASVKSTHGILGYQLRDIKGNYKYFTIDMFKKLLNTQSVQFTNCYLRNSRLIPRKGIVVDTYDAGNNHAVIQLTVNPPTSKNISSIYGSYSRDKLFNSRIAEKIIKEIDGASIKYLCKKYALLLTEHNDAFYDIALSSGCKTALLTNLYLATEKNDCLSLQSAGRNAQILCCQLVDKYASFDKAQLFPFYAPYWDYEPSLNFLFTDGCTLSFDPNRFYIS